MDALDLGRNLPIGFCDECCSRMAAGAHYEAVEYKSGEIFMHAYCAHREAGAMVLLRQERDPRWTIVTPIDALEWQHFIALKIPMLAGAFAGAVAVDAAAVTDNDKKRVPA